MNSSRLRRSKQIIDEEGFLSFLKHAASFLLSLLFHYSVRFVYERRLDNRDLIPIVSCEVENLELKTITRLEEFDGLLTEGFDLSWYEMNPQQCKERLSKGAILFCALVREDVAHITWVATTKGAQADFYHFDVDYGHEACIGGTATSPKYRGKGIYTYVYSQIFQYLGEKGYSNAVIEIHKNNIPARETQYKLGSKAAFKVASLKLLSHFNLMWTRPIR